MRVFLKLLSRSALAFVRRFHSRGHFGFCAEFSRCGGLFKPALKNVQHGFAFSVLKFFVDSFRRFAFFLWHRAPLLIVFVYFLIYFNPFPDKSSGTSVLCPDSYAYRVSGGRYIKCEDFDEYYEDLYRGVERTDMYLIENQLTNKGEQRHARNGQTKQKQ